MRRVRSQFLGSVFRLGFAVRGRGVAGGAVAPSFQGAGALAFDATLPCRPGGRRVVAAISSLVVAVVVLLAVAVSAGAAVKGNLSGEHGFGFPNGTDGGQLRSAVGVAVNRTGAGGVPAGSVYVAEGGPQHRVSQFTADGEFVRAWGFDVIESGAANDNGTGFEVCDVTDGNLASDCKAGVSGAAAGQLSSPSGIAIDQSNGYLYVGSGGNRRVDVFSAVGEFAGAFGDDVYGAGQGDPDPAGPDFCTTACQASAGGSGAGAFSDLTRAGLAVDPDVAGRVLVPDNGNLRVSEYQVTIAGGVLTGVSFERTFGSDVVSAGPGNRTVDRNERQTTRVAALDFSCFCFVPVTGGTWTLSFDPDGGGAAPAETTGPIPFDAGAAVIQQRLVDDLASIAPGDVTVSPDPGPDADFIVEFTGAYAGDNVADMVADGSNLTADGGAFPIAEAVTIQQGGQYPDGLEVCVPGDGDSCKAGVSGSQLGEFTSSPTLSAAVDSDGAVYVTSGPLNGGSCSAAEPCRVQKFAPDLSGATAFGPVSGIGRLTHTSGAAGAVGAINVAVDPANDHVFVLRKGVADRENPENAPTPDAGKYQVVELDSDGAYVETHPGSGLTPSGGQFGSITGLAVGTDDRLYVNYADFNLGEVFILGPVPDPSAVMGPVADVDATSATFNGQVTIPAPGQPVLSTKYRFEYSTNGVTWSRVPDTDQDVGDGSEGTHPVTNQVTGLQPCTLYAVRIVANTGGGGVASNTASFVTDCVAPRIGLTFVDEVTKTDAQLGAHIDPQGEATSYHFEWGTTTSYGNRIPAFERQLGNGNNLLVAKEQISGLQPATTYHYRVVATNGTGPDRTTTSPDDTFETLNECNLTQDRCFELVSPPDKGPTGAAGTAVAIPQGQTLSQVAPDGEGLQYIMAYGTDTSTTGEEVSYLARRGPNGWIGKQLAPPTIATDNTRDGTSIAAKHKAISTDLACGVFSSVQPVTEDAPQETLDAGHAHLFRRNVDDSWTNITSLVPLNPPPNQVVEASKVIGMSDDCGRIVFATRDEYPGIGGAGGERLYKWDNGNLFSLGEIPAPSGTQKVAVSPGVYKFGGFVGENYWNAVSDDGSRVFFSALSLTGGDTGRPAVFLQEDDAPAIDVSQSQAAALPGGAPNNDETAYETAAADGSRVIFRGRYGLASNAAGTAVESSTGASACDFSQPEFPAPGAGCDLYAYDVASGKLTDLSASGPGNPAGASVAGVLGASEDAKHVYFAARGQLVAGKGKTEAQNLAAKTWSIYLSADGDLKYVGQMSADERREVLIERAVDGWSSQVTPDGGHLLLATYQSNAEHDTDTTKDVYLFDAVAETLDCVSCRRDLNPSVVSAAAPITGPGDTLNMLRPAASVSADGDRVFFVSAEPLAHGAPQEAVRGIYEWHRGQVSYIGRLDSTGATPKDDNLNVTFLPRIAGTTPNGGDFFFNTMDRLSWQDTDSRADYYTARVGGGFEQPAISQEPPCDALTPGSCQGGGSDAVPTDTKTSSPSGGEVSGEARKSLALSGLSRKALRAASRRGVIPIRLRASSSGPVTLTARARLGKRTTSVGRRTIRVRKAGVTRVGLWLDSRARDRLRSGRKLRVTIRVRQAGARTRAMSILLPGVSR